MVKQGTWIVAAALAALAGCVTVPASKTAPASVAPAATSTTWFSPPGDFPGICMTLASGGQLSFAGGFGFYNPGRWSLDEAGAELRLELGGSAPFPAESAKYQMKHRPGSLLGIDETKRRLSYRLKPETASIELGGFVFYRKLACK